MLWVWWVVCHVIPPPPPQLAIAQLDEQQAVANYQREKIKADEYRGELERCYARMIQLGLDPSLTMTVSSSSINNNNNNNNNTFGSTLSSSLAGTLSGKVLDMSASLPPGQQLHLK
jgi:hypothetical protein